MHQNQLEIDQIKMMLYKDKSDIAELKSILTEAQINLIDLEEKNGKKKNYDRLRAMYGWKLKPCMNGPNCTVKGCGYGHDGTETETGVARTSNKMNAGKYKTVACRNGVNCPYKNSCTFKHDDDVIVEGGSETMLVGTITSE